ncbi:MAG: outer membrane beta-barrel protein [Crocinitomix sp.]|nr:outer membrane beta-barrel protein [Crocinitomix sp.]
MRFRLSIIAFLFINLIHGQEESGKFQFGITTYSNLSNGFAKHSNLEADKYIGIASTSFSYSAGIKFAYQFKNNFGISSGLIYMKTGDRSLVYPPDPMRGFFTERRYKHKTHYVEFPLNFYRTIATSFQIIVGGSYLFNISNQSYLNIEGTEGYELDLEKFERTNIGATLNLGFGYSFPLGDQTLEFIPYAQYNFIHPMNDSYFIDNTPFRKYGAVGLQINFLFYIKSK